MLKPGASTCTSRFLASEKGNCSGKQSNSRALKASKAGISGLTVGALQATKAGIGSHCGLHQLLDLRQVMLPLCGADAIGRRVKSTCRWLCHHCWYLTGEGLQTAPPCFVTFAASQAGEWVLQERHRYSLRLLSW